MFVKTYTPCKACKTKGFNYINKTKDFNEKVCTPERLGEWQMVMKNDWKEVCEVCQGEGYVFGGYRTIPNGSIVL